MKAKFLIYILLVPSAYSCSPRIYPASSDSTAIVNTEIREVVRDSIIFVPLPHDSTSVVTEDTTSVLEIGVAISEAMVSQGKLYHNLYTRPGYQIQTVIQFKERAIYRDRLVRSSTEQVREVERDLNAWQRAMMGGGYILLGLLAAGVAFKISKLS